MAEFHRNASSTWSGDLKSGKGSVSTQSGALQDAQVTFVSRFENQKGSNPEELIAAAHAACFSMALSANLSGAGHVPDSINTTATVTLRMDQNGPAVTKIHLLVEGKVPGVDEAAFQAAAEQTKTGCPISRLLTPGLEEVSLEARLLSS
jgi:osmotically inducible protein OsmC